MWCGVDEKSRTRGKEGCVVLFQRVCKGIKVCGWKESTIVWAVGK